jgi:hypothetical protein
MPDLGIFTLRTDTLRNLDRGRAAIALNAAIDQAVKDCLNRPGDDRARKVTMVLEIKPVSEVIQNEITCEGATGKYCVRVRVPDWESNTLDFGVKQNGTLVFSENSPANHCQTTIFDDEEGEV